MICYFMSKFISQVEISNIKEDLNIQKEVESTEKAKLLKEEVRETLVKTQGSLEQLEMIDSLQRLGISYHYKHEIHD